MSNSISNTGNTNAVFQQSVESLRNRIKPSAASKSTGLDPLATAKEMNPISLASLDSLSVARGMQPIIREVTPGRFDNIDFSNTMSSGNLHGGPALQEESQTIFNYNGRDFYAIHPDYEQWLNDPDIKVGEGGWLTKTTGTLGDKFTIYLLGRAVDAPEYVPPKYTTDFIDASSDFIMKAAQEYARTGNEETLSMPYYSSDKFVSSALDFLSAGKALPSDIELMKASIESIIKELAEMIKNGEEADLSKVKGKVDIMGEQVSLTELLDMQKYAKELSNQLVGENKEWLRFGTDNVSDAARRGLIKSMGMAYGDQIGGAVGEMFKSAWAAEVDRHAEVIKNGSDYAFKDEFSIMHNNFLKNGADYIYDVFSKIDTSSKENALESYKALSGEIDAAINKFLGQYTGGVPGGMAAKMRAEVDSYFYDLMGFKSVDTMA